MKSLQHCRDPGKTGQNFIPANQDHGITNLVSTDKIKSRLLVTHNGNTKPCLV